MAAASGPSAVLVPARRYVFATRTACRRAAHPCIPLQTFAGVVALLNDFRLSNGKSSLGFLNPLIYASGVSAGFNDITSGSNPGCGTNGFTAGAGWDPVSRYRGASAGNSVFLVTDRFRLLHRSPALELRTSGNCRPSSDEVEKDVRGSLRRVVYVCKSESQAAGRNFIGRAPKRSNGHCCGLPGSATHGLLRGVHVVRRPLLTRVPHGLRACITRAVAHAMRTTGLHAHIHAYTAHTLHTIPHGRIPCPSDPSDPSTPQILPRLPRRPITQARQSCFHRTDNAGWRAADLARTRTLQWGSRRAAPAPVRQPGHRPRSHVRARPRSTAEPMPG